TKTNPPAGGQARVATLELMLDLDATADGAGHRVEFRQQVGADDVDHSASVLRDDRPQHRLNGLQDPHRPLDVRGAQAAAPADAGVEACHPAMLPSPSHVHVALPAQVSVALHPAAGSNASWMPDAKRGNSRIS